MIHHQKGFTLYEIVVAVGIVALLSAIVIASLTSVRTRSHDLRRISDIKQLKGAIENYFSTCYDFPASLSDLAGTASCPEYTNVLTAVPVDPYGGSYSYYTDAPSTGKRFHVCATLDNASNDKGKAGLAEFDTSDPCDGSSASTYDLAGGII